MKDFWQEYAEDGIKDKEKELVLNKDILTTLGDIKLQYIFKNKELSEVTQNVIVKLEAENKELENAIGASKTSNTDKESINWHT